MGQGSNAIIYWSLPFLPLNASAPFRGGWKISVINQAEFFFTVTVLFSKMRLVKRSARCEQFLSHSGLSNDCTSAIASTTETLICCSLFCSFCFFPSVFRVRSFVSSLWSRNWFFFLGSRLFDKTLKEFLSDGTLLAKIFLDVLRHHNLRYKIK